MGQLEEEDYEIKTSMTLQSSILHYFSHAQLVLKNYNPYLNRHRELDFTKMRRFLHTTYNSLTDIDPHFKSNKILKLYENMLQVSRIYDDFVTKSRLGVRSYYLIFLKQQERYTLLESLLRHNLNEIEFLRQQTTGFKESVEKFKRALLELPRNSSMYQEKENALKLLKRRENSTIVRLGEVQEQNIVLSEVLRHFSDSYETQFLSMFEKFTQSIKPKLLSILNAMAFELDVELWLRANESIIIKNYFKNSYNSEVINAKTYLTYYLKGLDHTKLNNEHKELQTLLDYLNTTTPIYCVIYMPVQKDLDTIVSTLKADDNGIVIYSYTDAKVALTQAFKTRINILILDLESDELILESFLSSYQNNSHQLSTKAKILLVCDSINDRSILKAEMLGADSLIERTDDAFEIIDAVYELLKVNNSTPK